MSLNCKIANLWFSCFYFNFPWPIFLEIFTFLSCAGYGHILTFLVEWWSREPGHSTHFQVGGDNSKVEGGILQNQHAKQSHILLSL